MSDLTVEYDVHFKCGRKTKKELREGQGEPVPRNKLPRVSRIMALAIHLDELVRTGQVKDYAELSRLGQVHRSRITQIMMLLYLAPDIQEAVLFLSATVRGRDAVQEHELREIAGEMDWRRQRRMWRDCGIA
jgi:hypothetical protein